MHLPKRKDYISDVLPRVKGLISPLFVCVYACVCVPGLGGFPFRHPEGLKQGTHVSLSKVDQIDTTGPAISDGHDMYVGASYVSQG